MQGKRPIFLLITMLVLFNLVATNLQAHEVQTAFETHIEQGFPNIVE